MALGTDLGNNLGAYLGVFLGDVVAPPDPDEMDFADVVFANTSANRYFLDSINKTLEGPFSPGTLATSTIGGKEFAQFESEGQTLTDYSEQLDNAAWAKTNLSVTADDTTAPNGTETADKLIADAA